MTTNNQSQNKRKVPAKALLFGLGPMKFDGCDPVAQVPSEAPISMFARSGEPIFHWYWGWIVHDMAGMQLRKETCPIDYCHWEYEPIGYLDTFKTSNDGLQVSGKLISFKPDDQAAEVIFKGSKGVPYEASIDFGDGQALIEEIPPGMTVQVNGYDFTGPGYVVRKWSLLGVAVCPFGADPNTETEFSKKRPTEIDVAITQFSEPRMSQVVTPAPAAAANVSQETHTVDAAAQFRQQLKRFTDRFGAAQGSQWFADGLSYDAALEKFAESQTAALTTEREKNAALEQRLAAAPKVGEATPVKFGDGEANKSGGLLSLIRIAGSTK